MVICTPHSVTTFKGNQYLFAFLSFSPCLSLSRRPVQKTSNLPAFLSPGRLCLSLSLRPSHLSKALSITPNSGEGDGGENQHRDRAGGKQMHTGSLRWKYWYMEFLSHIHESAPALTFPHIGVCLMCDVRPGAGYQILRMGRRRERSDFHPENKFSRQR